MPIIDTILRRVAGPLPVTVSGPASALARPKLTVAGIEQPGLGSALLRLTIEKRESTPATCVALFQSGVAGGAPPPIDPTLVDYGKEIVVALTQLTTSFRGRVTALQTHASSSAPPTVELTAEDRLLDLRSTTRTRVFADSSLADVARRIAGDHGLTPDVSFNGQTFRQLAQIECSDLDFLRARADEADAWFAVDDRSLSLRPRSDGGRSVAVVLGRELVDLTVTAGLGEQRSHVIAGGWDVAAKRRAAYGADSAALGTERTGRVGTDLLVQAIGRRSGHVAGALASDGQARERAEAALRSRARAFVTARALLDGVVGIAVGGRLEIMGAPATCNGAYRVVALRHVFDTATGMHTEAELQRPWVGAA